MRLFTSLELNWAFPHQQCRVSTLCLSRPRKCWLRGSTKEACTSFLMRDLSSRIGNTFNLIASLTSPDQARYLSRGRMQRSALPSSSQPKTICTLACASDFNLCRVEVWPPLHQFLIPFVRLALTCTTSGALIPPLSNHFLLSMHTLIRVIHKVVCPGRDGRWYPVRHHYCRCNC